MDVPGRLRTSLDATVHRLIAGVPRPRDSQQKSRDEEDGFFSLLYIFSFDMSYIYILLYRLRQHLNF